ncbi:hypothetical protein Tco_0328189 [Tanacetum coccineum]
MPSIQGNQTLHLYIFLSEKIFEQVRINPDILVKAVQDQLQRELEVQISMSKAFRAKAKAERDIIEDHVLQYSMLRDYVVELQSTNPNTTVKIAVERNTGPFFPTRVFQRIYICQVLVAVRLDSNNGIYLLAYALVEAESRVTKEKKKEVHEDEPFMKDDKLSRKGRTITCQSCGNTRHNKATCKGQGGNNAEASGSASGQAQQTEPAVGQDGSGGSGAGAVIGLSAAGGEGGAGVASQGSSRSRWTKRRVKQKELVHKKNSHSTYKSTFYQFSSASE